MPVMQEPGARRRHRRNPVSTPAMYRIAKHFLIALINGVVYYSSAGALMLAWQSFAGNGRSPPRFLTANSLGFHSAATFFRYLKQ
jgi:hypothetical protein